MIVSICLCDVHVVSFNVGWKHCQGIKVDNLESWLIELVGCHRCTNIAEHDWFSWVCHALGHLEPFVMSVACHCETNNVLVSFHEGSKTSSKLMLHVIWWVMGNNNSNASSSFNISQFLLKPSILATWIRTLSINEVILTISGLGIQSDQFGTFRNSFSVLKSDWHAIVTVFGKLFHCLVIKPICPILFEVVNLIVVIRFIEILIFFDPSVVVTVDRQNCDVLSFKSVLYHLGYNNSIYSSFICCIVPNIVRSVVSGPE